MGCRGMDWTDLAEDRDVWLAVMSAVMNLRLPWYAEKFLISWGTVCLSDGSFLHGISGKGWSQFQGKVSYTSCPTSPYTWHKLWWFRCQCRGVWEESWCPFFPQLFLIKCDCGTLKHNLSKSVFFRHYVNVTERGLARDWGECSTPGRKYLLRFSMLKLRCCVAAVSIFNTFTAIVDLSRFNNSCLKSPASN